MKRSLITPLLFALFLGTEALANIMRTNLNLDVLISVRTSTINRDNKQDIRFNDDLNTDKNTTICEFYRGVSSNTPSCSWSIGCTNRGFDLGSMDGKVRTTMQGQDF